MSTSLIYLTIVSFPGFCYFATIILKQGDFKNGRRFARLAKMLITNPKFKEAAGEVLCITTAILCFFEPLQSTVPFHLKGEGESGFTVMKYICLRTDTKWKLINWFSRGNAFWRCLQRVSQ